MVTFLTLYRGRSIADAELIAVATNPDLVAHVAGALLGERAGSSSDPAIAALNLGRRRALRLLRREANEGPVRSTGHPQAGSLPKVRTGMSEEEGHKRPTSTDGAQNVP